MHHGLPVAHARWSARDRAECGCGNGPSSAAGSALRALDACLPDTKDKLNAHSDNALHRSHNTPCCVCRDAASLRRQIMLMLDLGEVVGRQTTAVVIPSTEHRRGTSEGTKVAVAAPLPTRRSPSSVHGFCMSGRNTSDLHRACGTESTHSAATAAPLQEAEAFVVQNQDKGDDRQSRTHAGASSHTHASRALHGKHHAHTPRDTMTRMSHAVPCRTRCPCVGK